MKRLGEYLIWYSLFSFVIFATWEWVQTPFFVDITNDLNTIVWYRIHCTIGDIMILFFSMMGTILIYRKISWIYKPEKKHYITVLFLGSCYTLISEYRNVHKLQSWDYSALMPEIFGIGLVPIFQWILLPPLILYIISRFIHTEG
ncbi:hypothetical protein EXM22_01795 [Oceanispirochaeta crateris]|uniref:Uncharacterized protein n=1 Tax=Oceanispirochaeta crateris TaxID=2518645 RepID=A0A5C1QJL4_9SPIO|nr:hypothetical protein EXM22_01795 [Oceanispirochaeta crateris]